MLARGGNRHANALPLMPRNPYLPSATLPDISGVFVGRQKELELLEKHLCRLESNGDDASPLQFLHFHGLSGVGKSRLLQKAFQN